MVIELVAGYCNDLKPVFLPLLVSLGHLFVVCRGEASLTGDIDYHGQSFIFQVLKAELFASDVLHLKVEEALDGYGVIQIVCTCLPD